MGGRTVRAGVNITYAGRRLLVLTDRVILKGDGGTTAEFYSMAEARSFVRYLNRLAKEEGKKVPTGDTARIPAGRSEPREAGLRRTFDSSPSSASRRPSKSQRERDRAAELDEAWRGW